jgi:hypothetical protein
MSETQTTAPAEKPLTKAQKVATADAARQNSVTPSPENDPNLVTQAADLVKPGSKWTYGNGLQIENR